MAQRKNVKPTPFRERNGKNPFNASGVVRTGSRRFTFVDNKDPTALFEMTFDADVETVDRIRRRRLTGADGLGDPEGLARADLDGGTFLIVSSSLSVAEAGRRYRSNDGLVRVRYLPDGDLPAEPMAGFRDWLLAHVPALAAAGRLEPDAGGLNIEGLAWDAHAGALLFGLRGPAVPGRVTMVQVPVDLGRNWTTAALGTPVLLSARLPPWAEVQGIRDISRDARTGAFLLLLGRSASHGEVPFRLGTWNRGDDEVRLLDVTFHRSAKPEGVTTFAVGDEWKILVVDDEGGYAVL
ncbi:hypothetical protein QRX60_33510 [Amycolatopsis mongoliensis]|uniref:DUF3616 domain-containing protein n=1 Tax=Amycolatopsis mongoliensis TaxID=715475 RepID=A0A9Y2NGR7_9PSEU|nr:hypothetical protein [Amycolatopsis sp. 4-36]WIX98952.1 hypothetical protein QRX60_33510 [Amycolatopsis sp. 4-36]